MSKLLKFLLWSLVFLALLLAGDQLLLRVPMEQPALAAVRAFYLDFRGRLLHLGGEDRPHSIDQVIERALPESPPAPKPAAQSSLAQPPPAGKKPAVPAPAAAAPRYLWVDGEGNLQFADRLEEVPTPYRDQARPLAE